MRPEKNLGGNNNSHFIEAVVYHLQNTVVSYVESLNWKKKKSQSMEVVTITRIHERGDPSSVVK